MRNINSTDSKTYLRSMSNMKLDHESGRGSTESTHLLTKYVSNVSSFYVLDTNCTLNRKRC